MNIIYIIFIEVRTMLFLKEAKGTTRLDIDYGSEQWSYKRWY